MVQYTRYAKQHNAKQHNAKLLKEENHESFQVRGNRELCDAIWDCTRNGQAISEADVRKGLDVIFSRERDHYEIFIRRLTALQMRVLAAMASKGGQEVFSVGFLSAASVLNAASVKRAIDRLVSDGLVFYNDREYRFVNPFFREWLKRL